MTVKPGTVVNPSHACHSADVLTSPERHVDHRMRAAVPKHWAEQPSMRWGDCQHIRDILEAIKGRP